MIHVDRNQEAPPDVLIGERASAAYARAAKHFANEDAAARQQLCKFEPLYHDKEVRAALSRLFADKCAFCESRLETAVAAPIVHHFRPKQEAVDHDGAVSRPHYWWLAYEWDNLYLSCQRCATAAGASFFVAGTRARVHARGPELSLEEPQLVDPCDDVPDEHLRFTADGIVEACSERGRTTIATYALNRAPLVEARERAIAEAHRTGETRPDRTQPYAGAIRRALAEPTSVATQRVPFVLRRVWLRLLAVLEFLAGRAQEVAERRPPVQPVIVERLELTDFRSIERLVVELAGQDREAPWTMLLGENGCGKTSVLQGLALVLMGEDARRQLDLNAADFVRRGAKVATIEVRVRGEIEPRTLRIESGVGFSVASDDDPAALAAYGAARIPSKHQRPAAGRSARRPRVENLFDPASALITADRWLTGLDDESFDFAGRALRRLLLEPEETVLERVAGRVVLKGPEGGRDLGELSDGYRSMIALAADLMSFFMTRYGSMDAAEGVVLVDEIGAHLHPRWQMRVVEAFREAFPRLQFVATTHDPLCLRGLDRQEVVVLRHSQDAGVFAVDPDEVPSVKGLRVDELLTSEVFGLSSTVDPELEQLFERYYALLAADDRGPDAVHQIEALKARLAAHRQFGTTTRERLALEAADEYLAHLRTDPAARKELQPEMKEHLRAIWASEER